MAKKKVVMIGKSRAKAYGIFTMALPYAFALLLPIITTFFFAMSVLEDSGYLPRLSVLLNRFFRLIGLNGKAVFPVILGFGCGTMAILSCRILDTKKEKVLTDRKSTRL